MQLSNINHSFSVSFLQSYGPIRINMGDIIRSFTWII